MNNIEIIGLKSEICWWRDCVGQICPVLDVYKETGFIKIQVQRTEPGFPPYSVEGWIDPDYVKVIN